MKGLIAASEPGRGAALLRDGRLEDFLFDPPDAAQGQTPEALVWARVDRVAPQLGAAFLTLPGGGQGWLRGGGRPGDMRLAQVSRWADPDKAAPLTDRPVLKGRAVLLTPGAPGANVARGVKGRETREWLGAVAAQALAGADADLGVVLRTAAQSMRDADILEEAAALRAAWAEAQALAAGSAPVLLRPAPDAETRAARDWPAVDDEDSAPDAFERLGVWDALRALRGPRVALERGAWMSVEATAALVAVDVNTGDDFSKGAAQAANLAACAELPRQLRLRGLGGVVYLDLAPIKKGARQGVDGALKRAFGDDPIETRVIGWTPAGAVEMQRRRERPPLAAHLRRIEP